MYQNIRNVAVRDRPNSFATAFSLDGSGERLKTKARASNPPTLTPDWMTTISGTPRARWRRASCPIMNRYFSFAVAWNKTVIKIGPGFFRSQNQTSLYRSVQPLHEWTAGCSCNPNKHQNSNLKCLLVRQQWYHSHEKHIDKLRNTPSAVFIFIRAATAIWNPERKSACEKSQL